MTTVETSRKYLSRLRDLEEIEADIRGRIANGEWGPGVMIPSRRDLARDYGVDLNVIQRALTPIIADKTLSAGVGRGTFVASTEGSNGRNGQDGSYGPPVRRSDTPPAKFSATVGIVADIWQNNQDVIQPHDNWPAAMVRAFEWAMASTPLTTVIFREGTLNGQDFGPNAYLDRVRELIVEGVDGIALILPLDHHIPALERLMEESGIPFVSIGANAANSWKIPTVICDDQYDGYQAAQHLIQRGYRNISFFCPYAEEPWTAGRRAGVEAALRAVGRSLWKVSEDELEMPKAADSPHRAVALKAAQAFVTHRVESWGVVAVNDFAGYGLLDAAKVTGLSPGADFGLIGFDDRGESRIKDMTSLHPPLDILGAEAAKLLQGRILGIKTTMEIRLRSHLVARSSTRAT